MYVNKNFSLRGILTFSGIHIIWISIWALMVACLFEFVKISWLKIPWLPLSIIATAVAFYIGFKNSNAYDRLWEARKIWGAIVNSSRAWGTNVKAYVSDNFVQHAVSEKVIQQEIQTLFYRHIAWLYALRSQLLIPTNWEHINQGKHVSRLAQARRKTFGIGLIDDGNDTDVIMKKLLGAEYERQIYFKNTATQIIDRQSQHLKELREKDLIDDFRHMELQKILNDFYTHQGKCERIKKFPFPRQYGSMSFVFVSIFIFLLPFGLASEFLRLEEIFGIQGYGVWLSVPFTILICWIYIMMELVGDYSENPFEGMGNDIPMMALCRTIEIDMREMLGETELPDPIKAKNGVLM